MKLGGVDVRQVTPSDLWKLKDEMAKQQYDSQIFWHKLVDDGRAATLLAIKDRMLYLVDHLNDWVPLSLDLSAESRSRIDVRFSIELPPISAEALQRAVNLERSRSHTQESLLRMERELRE